MPKDDKKQVFLKGLQGQENICAINKKAQAVKPGIFCYCLYILIKILYKTNQNKQSTMVCSIIIDEIELSTITNPNNNMVTGKVIITRGIHKG
ncbi:hypothetical protein GCM10022216_23920 [Sphingobacterium kyonggiense]|uniref:Uncharacterized protein n=1 Tax=Sphingobacterium kyonggiense TaxID=714075 RepID=A0ABP7Z052_9SPHI